MALILEECDRCKNDIPLDWTLCPHCGGHQNCPNVVMAKQPTEVDALERRHERAVKLADSRGAAAIVAEFQVATATSQAVLGSSLNKLKPIVLSDRELFATYHELAELRLMRESPPNDPDWNTVRPAAEIALLGGPKHIRQLHYAVVSLDGRSLPHYGECTIILRSDMIEHRASLFQENSAVYVHRHGQNLPLGSRGTWGNRAKLCTAKVADRIEVSTKPTEFSELLLKPGPTAIDDDFVEVQVFGPMTFRTFAKVTVTQSGSKPSSPKRLRSRRGTTDELAFKDYCHTNGVVCEIVK